MTEPLDEPLLGENDRGREPVVPASEGVQRRIQRLIGEQPFAVLCVQGDAQPYGALVAFAFSEDHRSACFITPRATRKYRLLSACGNVALVIDNRSRRADELMAIEAVTVTGHATPVERDGDFDEWSGLLLRRHPYLKAFVSSVSCALFRIDVVRFLHVMRFQEVSQWIPGARS